MKLFKDLIRENMESQNLSLRKLEDKVRDRFGDDSRVSKSTLQYYLGEHGPPKYIAAHQIAVVLGIDVDEAMEAVYNSRLEFRKNEEEKKYNDIVVSLTETKKRRKTS